jgi:predicted metalloprotease with PDZ domain
VSLGVKVVAKGTDTVTISEIEPRSDAETKGLKKGDKILDVGGIAVRTPQEFDAEVAKAAGKGVVLLQVNSGGAVKFVAVRYAGQAPASPAPLPADDLRDLERLE